jgi:hypothetical protein
MPRPPDRLLPPIRSPPAAQPGDTDRRRASRADRGSQGADPRLVGDGDGCSCPFGPQPDRGDDRQPAA